MSNCVIGDGLRCVVCGRIASSKDVKRNCKRATIGWQPIMVGDFVETALTTIGITQERVEKLTRTAGKPGGCGCQARKKWLNEAGVEVQKAIRETAKKVYGVG